MGQVQRTDDLVVETAGDEVVVYDLRDDRVHCLGATATRVWRAADGRGTGELAAALDLPAGTVATTLAELADRDLLLGEGTTRRDSLRKVLVGAAVAVPLIATLEAPAAAQSGSSLPLGAPCQNNGQCQSGRCSQGVLVGGKYCSIL
jgi:hypothetical protein